MRRREEGSRMARPDNNRVCEVCFRPVQKRRLGELFPQAQGMMAGVKVWIHASARDLPLDAPCAVLGKVRPVRTRCHLNYGTYRLVPVDNAEA